MDWQSQLISIYLTVCDLLKNGVSESSRRFSNNSHYAFTDEEAISLYLFGIISGHTTIKNIYNYTNSHLREWFPQLGGYEAFSYRLNRISDGFVALCERLVEQRQDAETVNAVDWVVDSLPIILAGPKRSSRGKSAADLANKGYCASKDLYFYGVKLHLVGIVRPTTIPLPSFMGIAPASESDNQMLKQVSHQLYNGRIFADKAYADGGHKKVLLEDQNTKLLTPIKKVKNLFSFPGADTFSRWVSSIRQPIESFFNWLQEKTKIQNASKVRSSAGLKVHIFGRFAAAMLCLA